MSDIYQPPSASLHEPIAKGEYGSVESAIAGDYTFNIGELLGEAWNTLKGLKTKIWVAIIVSLVIGMILQFAVGAIIGLLALSGSVAVIFGVGFVLVLGLILIIIPINFGIFMIAIKHSVNAPTSFSEIFNYFGKAGRLLLLYLVMTIMITIGMLLFVLPGIYLQIAYMMAIPLLMEKDMGVWEALETSRKAITKKWFTFFIYLFLCSLIFLVAALPLGIGLIWVIPWLTLAYAILYRNMFGVRSETMAS